MNSAWWGSPVMTPISLAGLAGYENRKQLPPDEHDIFGGDQRFESQLENALGPCLANAVLPVLGTEDLGSELIASWRVAFADNGRPAMLQTAAEFARLIPEQADFVVSTVRRGLASSEQSTALNALSAVDRLRASHAAGATVFPSLLASDIASSCAVRREPGLSWALQCARMLLGDGLLSQDDKERVISGLEFLFAETNYGNWDENDPRTSSLSLVRRECVQLAKALNDQGMIQEGVTMWLANIEDDPIPEVRFALSGENGAVDGERA